MAKADTGAKKRDLIPADAYDAWCTGSVELGTHDAEYEGKPIDPKKKLILFFEIPEVPVTYTNKDGDEVTAPTETKIELTNSVGKKSKLAPIILAMTGKDPKDVDLLDLVGVAARITIIHKKAASGNTYDKIESIGKAKQKDIDALPPMHSKGMKFSITDHGFDSPEFDNLRDWVKTIIKDSYEYKEYLQGPTPEPIEAAPFD